MHVIISMGWTTAAFMAAAKSVTRRDWSASYARAFAPGTEHVVYDRLPYHGGRRVGRLRVLSLHLVPSWTFPREEWEREGFAYMVEHGAADRCMAAWRDWHEHPRYLYRLAFERAE